MHSPGGTATTCTSKTCCFLEIIVILACLSPCSTCTSASVCTSCVANYYYTSSSLSCIACPSGTYSAGGVVTSCISNSIIPFLLYQFLVGCVSPCLTCISAIACTSCVANYYYTSSSSSCIACSPGNYSTGGTVASCTSNPINSCSSTEYLYSDNSCRPTCDPPNYAQNQGLYNICISSTQTTSQTSWTHIFGYIIPTCSSIAVLVGASDPITSTLTSFIKMLPYIRYMKINYPTKLQLMLDHSRSDDLSFQFGFGMPSSLANKFPQHPLPYVFAKYHLQSNFLVSYWTTMSSLLIVFCLSFTISMMVYFLKNYRKYRVFLQQISKVLRWNFILMIFFSSLDGIVLSTSLNLRTSINKSSSNIISLLFCVIVNIAMFAAFVLVVYVARDARKLKHTTHPENSKAVVHAKKKWERYKIVLKDLKTDKLLQHCFFFFYMFRIYVFYLIISYLYEYPLIQTILIMLLHLFIMSYLVIMRPFTSRLAVVQCLSDEITMLIVNISLLVLAISDKQGIHTGTVRSLSSNLIIYANFWLNISAILFLACILVVGLRKGYRAAKEHVSKGIVVWLSLFLSASGAGDMDIEITEDHEENKIVELPYKKESKEMELRLTKRTPFMSQRRESRLTKAKAKLSHIKLTKLEEDSLSANIKDDQQQIAYKSNLSPVNSDNSLQSSTFADPLNTHDTRRRLFTASRFRNSKAERKISISQVEGENV